MRTFNRSWLVLAALIMGLMLMSGCARKQVTAEPAVQATPEWFFSDIVDYDFVQQHVVVPRNESVMIIDSRPYEAKYVKGYIPTAYSIPDTQFDKLTDQLPADKNALLIFYCGGLHCKLSHKSAMKAVKLGYTNVKVYAEGFPDYKSKAPYYAIGVEQVHQDLAEGANYMLIDARPAKKYLEGNIPSSISIPDTQFEAKAGLLPADKSTQLIYYCGGFACKLSHKSAAKALAAGYTNVVVAEAGYPAWKKQYGTGGGVAVQAGAEEGSIDIAQFQTIVSEKPDSIYLIDVRDPDEFAAGHISSAVNIPVDKLEKQVGDLKADKPIVFVCASGARSGEAYYMIRDMRPDIEDVFYLEAETVYHKDGSFEIKKH